MKILPKSKKAIPPPTQLTDLIVKLLIATNEQLPTILKTVDSWKWPRSDLNSWIKILNKFDDIMDEIIREYNVAKLQLNSFTEGTKELLSEILRFERLLLENSTNRKTFSSYDRLNGLLSTSDLDILVLALNLLLRPSQQYSAQPAVSHALSISTTRLQSLAKRLPHLREYGISLVDLASNKGIDESEGVPPEAREVNFSFYRTDITGSEHDRRDDEGADAPSSSPRQIATANSSAVHLRLDEQQVISQPVMNVLADAIQANSVPESETFELLCRIRAAASLSSSKRVDREKLVIIRLLAIAIYGHTHSESQATSALFLYEPDLVAHIAELLQVDQGIPIPVQTAAIAALDALARYKNKVQEVLTAVNAGVNHGILMALVRNMVAEVANPDSLLPHSFVEALLSFITYIASHASGGNMVVGAGLIPLLIQAIENRSPLRLPVISKTMQLVDNVLYSFTNAFSLFCASRGVDVLVERIEYEIDLDIKEYAVNYQPCAIFGTGELPIQRVAVLKHILRSMHRMMQSPGTAEGLRGLIDMSLLSSIKKIVQYRGLFGANIFPLAVNIMSTFVHNEPTSLAIIQEVGLPELFYKAIEIGIEPAIEVIQAIPNAIGALCLNEAGQAQLSKRPSIIPAILAIFTSERHLKVLVDKENAVIIGTAVDELIRHHPSLKGSVFDAIRSTLSNIEDLGMSFICPTDIKQFYQLMPITGVAGDLLPDDDITMQDDLRETIEAPEEIAREPQLEAADEDNDEDDITAKSHDNTVVSFIDILGRFLEGFFQHSPHCRDFIISTDGLQRFGRLTGLPCLPYDFANSVASDSMVQVLRTMTEVATSETLLHLTEIVKEALDETRFFWESIQEPSKLLPFIDLPPSESATANQRFRSLVSLHIRITLLSDVFATARAANRLVQTLMSSTPLQVLTDLGTLHRASMWENIALNVGLSSKGIEVLASLNPSPLEGSPNRTIMDLPDLEASVTTNGASGANGMNTTPTLNPSENNSAAKHDGPRDWNANSLKHITQGLPNALAPFFQAMIKMFHARRNPDSAQKKQITEASKVVAQIMLKHLSLRDFDDKPSLYNYFSLILGLFTVLLVDERTSASSLHTVELFAFYQSGGFEAIFDICKILTTRVDKIVKIEDEHRSELQKKELSHAYSAIKIALHLLNPIVSSKPLFESGQTILILTRDKRDTDPDYFEAHNFLVKLRFIVLPTIRDLWEAPWLIQAPIGVSRYVARTVLEIANGEHEDSKSDPNGEVGPAAAGYRPRSTGPDEARIQILTDMGFPRSAAERALTRTHNNVNSATELLLSHPFPLPPDPVSDAAINAIDAAPEDTEGASGEDEDNANSSVSVEETDGQAPQHPLTDGNDQEPSIDPFPLGKTASEWRKALDEAREPLRASISRQSLLLIDEHLPLLFDLHIAFTKGGSHQLQAVRDLVDDIKAFSRFAYDVQEQPLANRCRLLALVLCENPSSLDQDLRNALMDHLLALLLSSINPEHPPRWLAAHLLVTEALLTLSDEPRTISLPREDEAIDISPIPVGPSRAEARAIVFDFCFRLIAIDDLPADELLSVLRLFVLLTRDREMAARFVKREGLVSLFKRIRNSAVNGGSSYIATILRHVVEDVPIIQSIMQQTIKRYFTQHRARTIDVNTYVRNCSAIALRDMDIFIDSTKSLCHMGQPFSSSPHISLRAESLIEAKAPQSDVEPSMDMQVDVPAISPSNTPQRSVESVIHLLIVELMNTVKAINETPSLPANVNNVGPVQSESLLAEGIRSDAPIRSNDVVDSTLSPPTDVHDKYQYLCFTMQCLTELLFSYDTCKVAFLSYSKKRSQQGHSKDQANKFRTATLHFLLSDLITYGTISPLSDTKHRTKGLLCSWAMNVVGALCVDTSSAQEMKDVSADLTNVRKFVLETISRAIKDLPPTESTEARYGRLLALADLCHRLLTVRVNPASRKQQDEVPTHLAKIMLEKNFVAILTTALSEIDLNYPNVRNLVAAILRPLEYLTKIAIKMSRASGKSKEDVKKDASVSSGSDDDDETMEDGGREETPDLYRHSALGIYAGEMDVRHYSEDEDMDEEDQDQDVEMEYGDETGSEDTSSSGSDHDEGDLDHHTPDSGEVWDEEGDEEEEDLVEQRDEEEEEEEEVGDDNGEGEDEEEDEDIMWEDIQEEEGALGVALEDVDNEAGLGVPIHINHEDDEPDMGSDEEEFVIENGNFHNDGIFSFADAFINPGIRDGAGLFIHRRHRDHQPFSRSRNAPAAPEATTHPLLLDMTSSTNRNPANQGRGIRHAHRILGTGPSDILQTIDQMLGEGSIQILQQLIPHDGGGTETFRIEVPAGTILHHGRRFLGSSSRTERAPRPQHHRQGREFDPLLTLQRWAEEMKILHGDFVTERVGKLANHVVLALLPAALEALKQAKIQTEQEALQKAEEKAKAEEALATQENVKPFSGSTISAVQPNQTTGTSPVEPSIPTPSPGPDQVQPDTVMADTVPVQADAEMADASEILKASPPVNAGASASHPVEETSIQSTSDPSVNAPERVTVMIHGSAVDITDTGIDPTFLEALPDDMREEVLNQHVRDQQAARVERPPDSQISSEFLDALPPEIRAEIIQQEALERARRRPEESASRLPAAGEPADIDPASFIASLDPSLRQAVLMDQDDGFIQTLPSHMIAEAGVYRDEVQARRPASRNPTRAVPTGTPMRKDTVQHDAILLLDRTGIAVLVRLLFFPQVLKKALLFKVLVNLCENAKTRTELFNILLSILQDGTGDLAAVDKSFAQMSVRNRDSRPLAPKTIGKQKATADYLTVLALPASQIETAPDLIAQRCLEALTYIVSNNQLSSVFFLTEHDLPVGLRRAAIKKGKGKEKQASQSHYPLVLLLNLLDRQNLLRTPAILESVVNLLATITRPLSTLREDHKVVAASGSASTAQPSAPPETPLDSVLVSTTTNADPETLRSTRAQHPEHPAEQGTGDSVSMPISSSISGPHGAEKRPGENVEEKALLPHAPQVPHPALRLIVNILTIGECSGRTFQQSLALIQHLSYIPDARDVIAHELKSKAQEFGQALYSDLDELANALQESSNNILVSSVASKFSPASSTQAKLLRVLKTIDYMYTPKTSSTANTTSSDDVEKVQAIYESFRFTPLWRRLGDCLSAVGEKPETEHIATVLLPLIEALMVVCKFVGSKGHATVSRALRSSASPRSPATPRESMEDLFISFTDAHRKVLNLMVRNNPSLMSGSFSLLVNNSRVLDFDNKRNYFNQQLHRKPHAREHYGTLQLNVRRARVFEDSFLYLQRKSGEQIKNGKLSVRFYDEEGVDAGGLTREWFQILARQMFNPNNALFQPCAADKQTYQPNKNSWVNPEHLSFFKFVGRVIGKAIHDGRLLDAYFARSLYRQLLGKPVDYRDVEWVDPEYYNSLCWILENDPTLLDLNFSVEADEFGVNRIVPLKEGGESISVTQENKREFVQLSAQYRLYSSIKDQIESLSNGFYEIIPKDLITIFNEQELELLISGTPDIDVDEWRSATEYNGYTSSDPNIVWWWRALKSFNRDERAKVLGFATGTSRVPLSGFLDLQGVQGVQRFSIHRAYGEPDRLPQAHTCFNQIDLPQYTSYEMLRQQLLMAINEGGEGFAFS